MEIKYAVDRIIDDILVLENISNNELVFIDKRDLNFDVNENDILLYKDGFYFKDIIEYNERINKIKERFNKLKRK